MPEHPARCRNHSCRGFGARPDPPLKTTVTAARLASRYLSILSNFKFQISFHCHQPDGFHIDRMPTLRDPVHTHRHFPRILDFDFAQFHTLEPAIIPGYWRFASNLPAANRNLEGSFLGCCNFSREFERA